MRKVFSDIKNIWYINTSQSSDNICLLILRHRFNIKREEGREEREMGGLMCSAEWAAGFYSIVKKITNYLLIMGLVSRGAFLNMQVFWLCIWWADRDLLHPGTDEFYLLLALSVLKKGLSLLLSTEVEAMLSLTSSCINFLVLWLGLDLMM